MHRLFTPFIILGLLTIVSCSSLKSASSKSDNIKPGMSKEEVIKLLGRPTHTTFYEEDDGTLFETLVYAKLVLRDNWYTYDDILEFKNNYLKSRYQGPERYHSKTMQIGNGK
ncbi:MAG: outer membrane protein assembly factor BamE [Niabella sp.]